MVEMKTLTINGVTYEVVDQKARDAAKNSTSLETTSYALLAAAWALDSDGLYAQTIAVSGVTTDPKQVIVVDVQQTGVDIDADDASLAAWAGDKGSGPASRYVTQGDGILTFHAKEAPTVNIPMNIAVG